MSEESSQLEVSNTAATFQCRIIYSLCPVMTTSALHKNVYVVHRDAYNNIIKALQTDRSCSELRTVTKDNTELAVHGVQWSVWSPCL